MEEIIKNSSEFDEDLNVQAVFIGGEGYIIKNPSVKLVEKACKCVAKMEYNGNETSAVQMMGCASLLAEGLSWLIAGDTSLTDKLSECPLMEIIEAWAIAVDMMIKPNGVLFTGELIKFAKSISTNDKSE